MASSEPTPTKRWSGVSVLEVWWWVLRRVQSCCLRSFWCLRIVLAMLVLMEGRCEFARIWVSVQAK